MILLYPRHLDKHQAAFCGMHLFLEHRLFPINRRAEPFALGWVSSPVVQSPHKAVVNWLNIYKRSKSSSNKHNETWFPKMSIWNICTAAKWIQQANFLSCRATRDSQFSPTHTNPNVIFCEPSSWLFPLQISLLCLVGPNKSIVPSGALSDLPLRAMLHDFLNLYFPHQPRKSSCEDLLLREHRPSWQSLTTSEVERCTLKYVSKDSRILWCILNLESNLASETQKTGKQHCHLPYLPYFKDIKKNTLDWIKKKKLTYIRN